MKHLNGHLLCAVDVETTGLEVGKHEIIQIAVLPLDFDLKPSTTLMPFDMKLKPENLPSIDVGAITVNKLKIANLILTGHDSYAAADLFVEWFQNLGLPEGKRIMPLASNWVFDKSFIQEWMGFHNFNYVFDGRYRDLMCCALYLNDKADIQTEQYPFPKVNLAYIANCLKVPFEADYCHNALYDCALTAACYREILRVRTGII